MQGRTVRTVLEATVFFTQNISGLQDHADHATVHQFDASTETLGT